MPDLGLLPSRGFVWACGFQCDDGNWKLIQPGMCSEEEARASVRAYRMDFPPERVQLLRSEVTGWTVEHATLSTGDP